MKKSKKNLRTGNFKKKDFDKVKEEINSIIAKVAKVDRSEIREDVNIRDRLAVESLDAMEILAAIETRFNITIDSAKAFDVLNVRDLYELVRTYLYKNNYSKDRRWQK